MPSDRATVVAKHGSTLAQVGIVVCFIALATLQMWSLSGRGVMLVGGVLIGILSLSYLYQGLFMIRYHDTTVEERIRSAAEIAVLAVLLPPKPVDARYDRRCETDRADGRPGRTLWSGN